MDNTDKKILNILQENALMTAKELAEKLSITGERARQLVRQAEKDITKVPGIKMLEQYL